MSRSKVFQSLDGLNGHSRSKTLDEQQMDAEQLFSRQPSRPMTREEKTAQAAKQIVQEESERRHKLSEALRAARLERAERFAKLSKNKRGAQSDE